MPALLYGIGAFALFAGLLMIGFGVPINEFSFGNTLIMAGTTASVGGLIIIGLGVVAGQLRRVAETMAVLPSHSGSCSIHGAASASGRIRTSCSRSVRREIRGRASASQPGHSGAPRRGNFAVAAASGGARGEAARQ
jgi:hypothetical protein